MDKENQDSINTNILSRLEKIEKILFGQNSQEIKKTNHTIKKITLAEVTRGKTFKNGQEKVSAIVGYYELELGRESVTHSDVRQGWRQAKFTGNYAPELTARAVKDGLINDYGEDGNYVLTQTGEQFYKQLK